MWEIYEKSHEYAFFNTYLFKYLQHSLKYDIIKILKQINSLLHWNLKCLLTNKFSLSYLWTSKQRSYTGIKKIGKFYPNRNRRL